MPLAGVVCSDFEFARQLASVELCDQGRGGVMNREGNEIGIAVKRFFFVMRT